MNHYFSRLAQRSSVTTAIPGRQARTAVAHAATGHTANADSSATNEAMGNVWGEQSVELSAPAYTSAQITENSNNANNGFTDPLSSERHQTSILTSSTGLMPAAQASHEVNKFVSAVLPSNSADLQFSASETELVNTPASHTASVISRAEVLTPNKSSSSFSAPNMVISHLQDSQNKSAPAASDEQSSRVNALGSMHSDAALIESGSNHAAAITNVKSTSLVFDSSTERVEKQEKKWMSQLGDDVQPVTHPARHANHTARVASNPVSNSTALTPAPTPDSAVQVNIGKIELEIFAPEKNVVQPSSPQPAAIVKPTRPDPVFNLHRHYLRSR
jgi:hypothetical protein